MTKIKSNPRNISDIGREINELESSMNNLAHEVFQKHPERSLLAHQAEWHIRGMLYHLRRVYEEYLIFVEEVASRVGKTKADVIIMYAPSFQKMLFEFYALVNLSRISMDNLKGYLAPLFKKDCDCLPKSIRKVLKGTTNCPIYNLLSEQELLPYLIDIRNCLVHYRSFAVSDNAYVLREGIDIAKIDVENKEFFVAMARAYFRKVGADGIAVNVFVPDKIFEIDARLAEFTYNERWNLLSTTCAFAKLGISSLYSAIQCLIEIDDPVFEFQSKRTKAK